MVNKILQAPRAVDKKQLGPLRSFLGQIGYYRQFIPNFATVSVPLTDLTTRNEPIIYRIETLKSYIADPPILKLPDFQKEFVLQTDACIDGIGYKRKRDLSIPWLLPVENCCKGTVTPVGSVPTQGRLT